MTRIRIHWYDVGGMFSIGVLCYVYLNYRQMSAAQFVLSLNLSGLFLHQLEEFRFPGYFPGIFNSRICRSDLPDRYPLNTRSAFVVNTMGWTVYLLSAIYANTIVWLGVSAMAVSALNVFAHTVIMNIRCRTLYNPGLATCLIFFVPLLIFYAGYVVDDDVEVSALDWAIGICLAVIMIFAGVYKLIQVMADRNTKFIFERRQVKL